MVHLPPPPVDMTPGKSPFYRGQVPTTAIVNPDSVRNFTTNGIPSYRIVPPQPLTLAGSSANAAPKVVKAQTIIPKPPAPTISEALTTTPVGFEFTFLQVNMPNSIPPGAVISTYKVYRNTTNDTGSAKTIKTIPHNPANVGDPVSVQDAQAAGTTMFYWVSAVNVSGEESTLTPAQSGSVLSGSKLGFNGKLATADDIEADGTTFGRINVVALNAGNVDIASSGVINKLISNISGVISDSVVKNGDFDNGSSGWTTVQGGTGVSFLSAQSGLPRGASCLQLSSISAGNILVQGNDFIPVDPAKTYLFECWMKIPVALTASCTLRPLLAEFDANKNAVTHVSGGASFFYQTIITSTTSNTWQYFAFECTGSAGTPGTGQFNSAAKFVQAGVLMVGSATTGQIGQIMGIRFSEVAAGTARAISAIDSTKVIVPASIDFSRAYLNKIIDNIGDGTSYVRLPNAPTNRNLIPDSGFKTWNSNTLYWVPSSWVLLPGLGADGGNAIGYLGTGSPSGFPEVGLRKNPILLSPGNYTLSAYMDATFVTTSALDMGLYLSIGSSGTPVALDGGPFHNTQSPGQKGRKFTNFTLAIRTRTNGMSVAVNDLILDSNGNLQACTVAGTLGGSAPTWSTVLGNNTTDGTATWRLINLAANMIGGTQVPFNLLMFPSNATVTAGKYAIISNPQLEPTPPSNTPTPYKENLGDDTTGTMLVDLANLSHGPMKISTPLKLQGSIIPAQSFELSFATSPTSIILSWTSQTITLGDGSTLTVASGGQSYTSGISPGVGYYLYPYLNVGSGTVAFTNGSPPPSSPNPTFSLQAGFDGRLPMAVIFIVTPSSGSGGGTSGGSTSCPEANELVEVQGKGVIRAIDAQFGDYIKGYSFEKKQDVFRRVIGKKQKSCAAWRIVEGHKVSPCEPVYLNSEWAHASRVPGAPLDTSIGTKVDLVVKADEFDEHNYWLMGERPLLIHNYFMPAS